MRRALRFLHVLFLKLTTPFLGSVMQVSIARTCNCIYALLQQRQRDIEFRESTNDQRQRCVPFLPFLFHVAIPMFLASVNLLTVNFHLIWKVALISDTLLDM
jgi:hypothetical protein